MIERLRLRNFRRYRDATLSFRDGVNFIEGQNNAGKTSLFYAIEYAFFGRVEGFKSIRSLMQPGKRSLGVEVVFVGRDGGRYLLQRVHQMPPRSKKTMDGHFTLKAIGEDAERYLLASDFGDVEDRLSLKLRELTGLTRRLFSVAIHARQGDVAAILEGAKQLDVVLGVTAAAMAEDELRQMALELEKESAGLAVLQERLRAIGNELSQVGGELTTLGKERQATAAKLTDLGDAGDPREKLEQRLAPLLAALNEHEAKHDADEDLVRRLDDEQERHQEAAAGGSPQDVEKELLTLKTAAAARAKAMKKMRADLDKLEGERRRLDQQRGDLAGRIERRQSLPTGADAACEVCGAPINAEHVEKELGEWAAEMAKLDSSLADLDAKQTKGREELDGEDAEERRQVDRVARLEEQREKLTKLEAGLARRRKERDEAAAAEKKAFAAVGTQVKAFASGKEASFADLYKPDGDPSAVVASIHAAIQTLRQSLAEQAGRQVAQRQAQEELLARFDAQKQTLERRQSDLKREQASATTEAKSQQTKADRAARFRRLSASFKALQAQIRAEAATKLAADTLSLHRQLSDRDEFTSLSIDPAQYAVQVVPRDLGEEVPAALYEGGGHRLLLGLSFRLAVARLVEYCPFLMLDEPTYGLDVAHREALLNRIANQDVSKQILLVTHQAMGDVTGHRTRVVRQGRETVVEAAAGKAEGG